MRVTFLTWRDPWHPDGGGSEVYVEQVAKRLVARGHEVTVRSAADRGRQRREVVEGVLHDRAGGRLTVYVRGLGHLLTRTGRQQDVVVDVINGLPFGAPLVRRRGLLALVHHVHREQWAIIYPNWKGRVGWLVESRLSPWLYARIPHVTVSQHSADDLARIGIPPSSITVVPNGLDHSDGPPQQAKAPLPRLVVLARLVPHKQIEHALDVVAALRPQVEGLHLDVVGDGWWRDNLMHHASRLGIVDAVTFHGHVPDRERDRLLAQAWVKLLPSVKEGWGIAVTEAARSGTPTIGYRSSGGLVESIVDGVTGLLVDDVAGLRRATAELLSDTGRREAMSAAARARSLELDWDATTERFEEALGQCR